MESTIFQLSKDEIESNETSLTRWKYENRKLHVTCLWRLENILTIKSMFSPKFKAGYKKEFMWQVLLSHLGNGQGIEVTLSIDKNSKDFRKCKFYLYDYTLHKMSNNFSTSRKNFSLEFKISMNEQIGKSVLQRTFLDVGDVFITNMIFEDENRPKIGPSRGSSILSEEYQDFEDLLESGSFSDVFLIIGNKKLKAHKNILVSRSPVFLNVFESNTAEKDSSYEVRIDGVGFETMKRVLRFMYTGQLCDLGEEKTKEILKVACKYEIFSLISVCENYLVNYVNVGNVFEMLELTEICDGEKIKKKAFEVLIRNFNQVDEKQFLKMKPEMLMRLNVDILKSQQTIPMVLYYILQKVSNYLFVSCLFILVLLSIFISVIYYEEGWFLTWLRRLLFLSFIFFLFIFWSVLPKKAQNVVD